METSQTTTQPPSRWKITTAGIILAAITLCCGLIAGILLLKIVQDNTTNPPTTQAAGAPTYTHYPTYTARPTYTFRPTLKPPFIAPTIQRPIHTSTFPPPAEFVELYRFAGTGKSTTDLFALGSGYARITWVFIGPGNFALYLRRLDDGSKEMLENTIGGTTGQTIIQVGASAEYLLDIHLADGNWAITVEYRP